MVLGPIVDIVIGMVFVYLLLGLITTAFQEVLSRALKLRGKGLYNALADLLADGDKNHPLFKQLFGHALVRGTASNDRPSYLPSRNFALALVDLLSDGSHAPVFTAVESRISGMSDSYAKESLTIFVKQAAGDIDVLSASVARWYDDAMDRLSGKYKRFSQTVALSCGLFFAVTLNVDSIHLAQALWANSALRTELANTASANARDTNGKLPDPTVSAGINQLQGLNLPIGWPQLKAAGLSEYLSSYFGGLSWGGRVLLVIGWLITALATSLGAPFWFETLQKVMNLRSTGPKPPRAGEAADKGK